jgi:hypothetical protein
MPSCTPSQVFEIGSGMQEDWKTLSVEMLIAMPSAEQFKVPILTRLVRLGWGAIARCVRAPIRPLASLSINYRPPWS